MKTVNRIINRSRIAAQNIMEGDEYIMRGEPNIYVESIKRNEDKGTVRVTFDDGSVRKFVWDQRVLINETPERHSYRRNSLRRNDYPNYLEVIGELA